MATGPLPKLCADRSGGTPNLKRRLVMCSTTSPIADRLQTLMRCIVLQDPPQNTYFGQCSVVHG